MLRYRNLPRRGEDIVKVLKRLARQTINYWQAARSGTAQPAQRGKRSAGRLGDQLRDRVILVIDESLPKPDRDAGSGSVFGLLSCLSDMGAQVYLWTTDGQDHPRYRRQLRELGVTPLVGYFQPDLRSWLKAHRSGLDYVLISRPGVANLTLQTVLETADAPVIYYGHDLHFARLARQAAQTGAAEDFARAEAFEALERAIWRSVDVAVYPSDEEAHDVLLREPDVAARMLTPYCFDAFPVRDDCPEDGHIFFVGSFSHPPNVQAAIWLAQEVFPRVAALCPTARLTIAGSKAPPEVLSLAGSGISIAGWLTDEALLREYQSARVGVVPLLTGAGVKLKIVEAMRYGLPVVSTSVGAQGLRDIEKVVVIEDDARLFAKAVADCLLMDRDAWLARSHAQLRYVERHFSREEMARSLLAAMASASAARNSLAAPRVFSPR